MQTTCSLGCETFLDVDSICDGCAAKRSVLNIVVAKPPQMPRLRARRVSEAAEADRALDDAMGDGRPTVRVQHGGSVANAYRYPAETETLVTVAFPDGRVVQFHGRRRANKVTTAWAGAAWDGRYSAATPKMRLARIASRYEWIGRAMAVLEAHDVARKDGVRACTPEALVARDYRLSTTPTSLRSAS